MKRIFHLVIKDLFTSEFNDLLDSWALIFAIVPFGALIFCGMYVGQFLFDSTALGVVLMFAFPLVGFAFLYAVRQAFATRKSGAISGRKAGIASEEAESETRLVIVRLEAQAGDGKRPMYALRRPDALENMYVQKGHAPSVAELRAQVGAQYPDVDWNHIVAEPPKSLTASMQRKEAQII